MTSVGLGIFLISLILAGSGYIPYWVMTWPRNVTDFCLNSSCLHSNVCRLHDIVDAASLA